MNREQLLLGRPARRHDRRPRARELAPVPARLRRRAPPRPHPRARWRAGPPRGLRAGAGVARDRAPGRAGAPWPAPHRAGLRRSGRAGHGVSHRDAPSRTRGCAGAPPRRALPRHRPVGRRRAGAADPARGQHRPRSKPGAARVTGAGVGPRRRRGRARHGHPRRRPRDRRPRLPCRHRDPGPGRARAPRLGGVVGHHAPRGAPPRARPRPPAGLPRAARGAARVRAPLVRPARLDRRPPPAPGARDIAADDAVLASGARATRYAEDLLAIAGAQSVPALPWGWPSRRSSRCASPPSWRRDPARGPLSRPRAALLAVCSGAVLLAVACAQPEAPDAATAVPAPPIAVPGAASTLDPRLQQIADEELDRTVAEWQPSAGVILVLDPATGEILANAGRAGGARADVALGRTFITGSTLKAVTLAAALEEGVVAEADASTVGRASARTAPAPSRTREPTGP